MITKLISIELNSKLSLNELYLIRNDLMLNHYEYSQFIETISEKGVIFEKDGCGDYYLDENEYASFACEMEAGFSKHTYENCLRRQGLL